MKVLFLNSCVSGGGAGRSLTALLAVPDPRVSPVVVMPEPGVVAARLGAAERIVYVPGFVERLRRSPYRWPDRVGGAWAHLLANGYALPRATAAIARLVRELKPGLIYCNHMLAKPVGAAAGAATGVPVVFHSRGVHHLAVDGLFYSWLGARRIVRRIICNSEASSRVYRRRSASKVTVVPNGIDTAAYRRDAVEPALRRELGIPPGDFVAGYVGRVHPKKGIDWLVRSFALFARGDAKRWLVVVGENDSSLHYDAVERYRELARSLGAGDQVVFTGFRDDVRPLLAGFDVLVFPSRLPESFGRVLIEAMAMEVPVITSAQGGSVEVVRRGEDGLWVEVDDVEGLAGALYEMAADPERRRLMGAKGRQRVTESYDSLLVARRIYDILVEEAR